AARGRARALRSARRQSVQCGPRRCAAGRLRDHGRRSRWSNALGVVMPSRPDLRELAANVKEAFGEMDRETLLDILTFIVKEYVVEGPPPMLVHQPETLADLQGLSFAQLISALQTRFDPPELAMFAVDGDQVSVRVGGV